MRHTSLKMSKIITNWGLPNIINYIHENVQSTLNARNGIFNCLPSVKKSKDCAAGN
jgi:hypothetical protein